MRESIRAEVRLTYGEYRRFVFFGAFRRGKGVHPNTVVYFEFFAGCLIVALLLLAFGKWPAGAVLLAVSVLVPARRVLGMLLRCRRFYRNASRVKDIEIYTFTREGCRADISGPLFRVSVEMGWDACVRAYETRDSFYIFVSSRHAHVVPKGDFTEGTPEELGEILRWRMGNRFIKCY